MSHFPPNRHKRQRSSAQFHHFHIEDSQNHLNSDHSGLASAESLGANVFPLPHAGFAALGDTARFPASGPVIAPNSASGQGFSHQLYSDQHAVGGFPFVPMSDEPLFELPAGSDLFRPHESSSASFNRPHPQTWSSAPEMHGHHKNVSISSHFDMFSLNEPANAYYPAAQPKQAPLLSHFSLPSLFPDFGRISQVRGSALAPQPHLAARTDHLSLVAQNLAGFGPSLSASMPLEQPYESLERLQHGTQHGTHHGDLARDDLLQSIVNVDAFNLNSYLLRLINETDNLIPLDDFYNLLYNNESYSSFILQNDLLDRIDKTAPAPSRELSSDILHQILDVFRDPQTLSSYVSSADVAESKLASVNFHELLRSFLALKILSDSLIEVKESATTLELPTLPRLSIYKVYYILCQKLILKYPSGSNRTSLQQKLILGQSKVGKLIKLVYPKLLSKRLGRRGESKYNYLGVKWNPNIVNDEINNLCTKQITELADEFKNQKRILDLQLKRSLPRRQLSLTQRRSSHQRRMSTVSTGFASSVATSDSQTGPQTTFFHNNTVFPPVGVSPLTLMSNPNDIDPETSWFGAARHHSLMALQDFNINLQTIRFDMINGERMANDKNWLFEQLSAKIELILASEFREEKEYLHLLLILTIELLPSVVIYDAVGEKSSYIALMKTNLRELVQNLGPRFAGRSMIDPGDIKAFISIIKHMIHLMDLLRSLCRANLNTKLLADLKRDMERLAQPAVDFTFDGEEPISQFRLIITQGILQALQAFQYLETADGQRLSLENYIQLVNEDSTVLLSNLMMAAENIMTEILQKFPPDSTISLQEMSPQISMSLVQVMHTSIVTERMARHYPIVVLKEMLTYITNQGLKFIHEQDGNPCSGPLNLAFRHWWVISAYVQEYFALISEIVGLHESLT